jgi:hypothetical protein
MKNSVLMRSINTLYFRQDNSLILKLTSGQRKKNVLWPLQLWCTYVNKPIIFIHRDTTITRTYLNSCCLFL